jgi:hypothetical protein
MVEACLLESDKGIVIVLLNWGDTPVHVPITNLTITLNNSTTNIPVGSLISSAQGNIVTPKLTTTAQPPFTITLSQLDYVDVITIDTGPHLVRTETVNLNGYYLNEGMMMVVVDVYPFHIIGGNLSIRGAPVGETGFHILLAEYSSTDQLQHVVSLETHGTNIPGLVGTIDYLRSADLPEKITGYNPFLGGNDTVSHITHLLLYNQNLGNIPLDIVLSMNIIYSS